MALAASSVAQAKPVAFKPPVELTDSMNIHYPVWVDANGDGTADLTGYDYQLGKMVSCVRDTRFVHSVPKRVIHDAGGSGLLFESYRRDMDGDGHMDLVGIEGRQIVWWKSAPGTSLAYQGAWGEPLPADRFISNIDDLDQDGILDVLLWPNEGVMGEEGTAAPAMIGYGNPDGAFTWREVNFSFSFKSYYGSSIADINGDGKPDWILNDQVALLQGREILEMISLPQMPAWVSRTQFGDLDGVPGAELVITGGYEEINPYYSSHSGNRIRILKWQEDSWVTIANEDGSLLGGGLPEPIYFGTRVGNFDADPAQELAIVMQRGVLIFGRVEDKFVFESSFAFSEQLQQGDHVTAVDREPDGRASFLIQRSPNAKHTWSGTIVAEAPFWLLADVPADPYGQSPVSVVSLMHFPRSLAVVNMPSGPKIASLGSHDKALHVWNSPTSAAEKRTVSFNETLGITLLAGKFRGGDVEELVWLTSDEDSAKEFSGDYKSSRLEVGRPYITDGNGISSYRALAYSGMMPAALLGKGDFDGDGTDDLLYTNPTDGMMVWRSGNDPSLIGAIRKLGPVQHEVGYMPLIANAKLQGASPRNIAVHDIDQDGDDDILQVPSIYGNSVACYINDGSGKFTATRLAIESGGTSAESDVPRGIAIGNFDGTGAPDVAVISAGHTSSYKSITRIKILRDGQVATPEIMEFDGDVAEWVVGDFNDDGLDDIVFDGGVTDDGFGSPVWGTCQILARKTPTSFHEPVMISDLLAPASALAVADMNGDGKVDLIHGSDRTGAVYYFEAATVETLPTFGDWAEEMNVAGQDVDSDGDGASNFHEYLTGRNPNVAETSLQSGAAPGEVPIIELKRGKQDYPFFDLKAIHQRPTHLPEGEARVILERSSNLRDWVPVDRKPTSVLTEGHPGWETLKWKTSVAPDTDNPQPQFFRIRSWIE